MCSICVKSLTHTTITPEIAAAGAVKHAFSCSSFTTAATDSNKSPVEVFKVTDYDVFNFLILYFVLDIFSKIKFIICTSLVK